MGRRAADKDADADRLPRFTEPLRPLVEGVARIPAGIQQKLFVGFIGGVALLVAMAVISLVVIAELNRLMGQLDAHARQTQAAQEMLYDVTAQSHYRTMAILDPASSAAGGGTWQQYLGDRRILLAERIEDLNRSLSRMDAQDNSVQRVHLQRIIDANERFLRTSREVDRLVVAAGGIAANATTMEDVTRDGTAAGAAAARSHVLAEHPASHRVESAIHRLRLAANSDMFGTRAEFGRVRGMLTWIVAAFSAVALGAALLLGYALSWSIILPVRKMEHALAQMPAGRFRQHVDVPNRDEFGKLARDLNRTSGRLALMFSQQQALARRLADTNASLMRANQAKSRFLASVSHELRTPMNAILGFTDAMLAGIDGPLNDEQRASLGWVQRGARDLLGLINEILDLSRIESGKTVLDAQPFDPRALVEAVVAQHRPLADQKGLPLTWRDDGAPAEVVQDEQRVRQVVVNLLGNALTFTREGRVKVLTRAGDDGGLVIDVVDTGPGIPLDQQEEIFEEFRTAARESTGSGLGLAISRRLARAMGGDVTVRSAVGEGSTFRVSLPATYVAPAGSSAAPETEAAIGGKVLVVSVDDDPSVAPLLAKIIGPDGYQVVPAPAASAVEEVARLRPAAVLLDILMPERSGGEVLRELKSDPRTRDVPVVVVSIVDADEVPAQADAYVGKPMSREALLVALEHARLIRTTGS